MKEKSVSHSILGFEDLLNCIAGKVRKTREGNFVIPLIDILGQEYGKVILNDDFGLDLKTVENVSLQTKKAKIKTYLWRGLFKVRIVKTFGSDKQNCLVEALEDFSDIKKGEQWITRRENLEA